MIAAEPHEARLLVVDRGALVAGGKRLLADANDGAYSPDGTLVAFAREGDLWLANADGSGQRRLVRTPNVAEWKPSWLPDGSAIVYSADVAGAKQIRILKLPVGRSQKLYDGSGATVSRSGKIAYVAGGNTIMVGDRPFDTTPTTYAQVTGLSWSPDGTELVYSADGTIVVDDGTTQSPGAPGTNPVWSPDGTEIFYTGADVVTIGGASLQPLGLGRAVDMKVVPTGVPLFPNLVQRPPSGLVVQRARNGHWLLGFTSMVDNRGPGIVWIKAHRKPGAHVMDVRQWVQLRNRSARVDPPSGQLHYVVAPPHYHWHLLGFVHAELRTAGDFTLRLRDHKSGSASPITTAPRSACRTARRGSSRTASSSSRTPRSSRRERRSATPTGIPRSSTGSSSTSRASPPASTGSCTARTPTSTSARRATTTTSRLS
ncbi:MAG TPA: hypothetical protein VGK79_16260 [Gaiellaceae bacterium]